MQASAFATASGGKYTIFAVMKFDSYAGQPYAYQRGTVNDAHSLLVTGGNTWNARRSSGNQGSLTFSAAFSTYYIVTTVFRSDLSRIYVGSTQGTDNTTSVTAPTGNKVLTLFALDSATRAGQPGFAEFLYYHDELSTTDQAKVRSYLSKKWNVTL